MYNQNKTKHNKTLRIFYGIFYISENAYFPILTYCMLYCSADLIDHQLININFAIHNTH